MSTFEQFRYQLRQRKGNEAILQSIEEAYKQPDMDWYLEDRLVGANLQGANFSNVTIGMFGLNRSNFSGATFNNCVFNNTYIEHANLERCEFFNCTFLNTHFSHSNLNRSNFSESTLRRCYLYESSLKHSSLGSCEFSDLYLHKTDLSFAKFGGNSLNNMDLSEAIGLDSISHYSPSSIGIDTLFRSGGKIPDSFLRGCGVPEVMIDYHRSMIGQAIDLYSCFISYSSADGSFAQRLHDTLQGQGIRCWFDKKDPLPGDDLLREIDRGIKIWDKFLLCCSRSALTEHWWVETEINLALQKEREIQRERGERVQILVPLDLDGYVFSKECDSPFKSVITERVVADYRGWQEDNSLFECETERLIRALRTDGGKNPPPESKI